MIGVMLLVFSLFIFMHTAALLDLSAIDSVNCDMWVMSVFIGYVGHIYSLSQGSSFYRLSVIVRSAVSSVVWGKP
jgi:hypothetical protein